MQHTMDFTLSDEDQILRRTIRDFARRELAPIAAEYDQREDIPLEAFRKLAGLGLTGLGIDTELGGGGGGLVQVAVAIEELARTDPSMSLTLLASLSLTTAGIERFGTDAQKQRYVPPLARGEALGAFCLTEPEAGSDAGSIKTRVTCQGDVCVLSGAKTFITNGDIADTYLVFANEDPSQGHRGITAFIVEKDTPGLESSRQTGKMGMRASVTANVRFEECSVPAEQRLGEPGQGFRIAMQILDHSRPVIAAQAVGIAQGALDLALAYVTQRQQFGQRIADFQGVQWMLADMATQVDAARLLTYNAANRCDEGLPFTKEASMAKLFASEAATQVSTAALQLHGGFGYFKESIIERFFRDAKVTEIYEGTSQIQRTVIARRLLAGE